jgi:hypothetical protein
MSRLEKVNVRGGRAKGKNARKSRLRGSPQKKFDFGPGMERALIYSEGAKSRGVTAFKGTHRKVLAGLCLRHAQIKLARKKIYILKSKKS